MEDASGGLHWRRDGLGSTTLPSVNPEDSLIRGNYAFAFPFIPRVPSPPPSPAMSCSSRWWQPPESCHPVSISRCSEEAGPVQAGWCRGSAGSAPPRASRYSSRGSRGTRGVHGLPPEARPRPPLLPSHCGRPAPPPSAASHIFSLVPQLLVVLLITRARA